MRVIVEGHRYALANFDGDGEQKIRFIHKEPVENSTDLRTVEDGTTNEEVLEMLIDRLQHLQAKAPCRENAIVITKLEEALLWLNKRTAERRARGVEGTSAE